MKLLHCELYWRRNTFLDGDFSKWRTHPRRINETSNVFFFVMHHYEVVNLSAKGICALWSPSWSCNYYRSTLSPFTVGGGTYGEKIDQIKSGNRCCSCSNCSFFWLTHVWHVYTFWLILMEILVTALDEEICALMSVGSYSEQLVSRA